MGITKSNLHSREQNLIASFARVLGHPARIAILQYLSSSPKCICGDLVLEIGLAQPTISQHLKELKAAGLIKGNIEGNSICYCIDKAGWEAMKKQLTGFLERPVSSPTCC